ncbi:type 11 methyltransferase [Mycolicibacterium canariasense]|uniref:Type 11 methyltransferase n=3 Tax=Mycolicibacterium canariasense TaxID=228230 RepID=A0A100W8A1_MYCCR|nr:type 11 methyltransferase [Mycolicibacterium canariasense]
MPGKLDGMDITWDCVIVGGGAAGLSAGLVLGRARRRTLVVDQGAQSNLAAHGIGGLLGHDGRPPAELYELGRAELQAYPSVQVRSGTVVTAVRDGAGFVLTLADGRQERARRVLLAAGMHYEMPEIPGLAELWGRSVFHCPFCHGWEARDQPLAVLAQGDRAVHVALLLRGWTDDVIVLSNGPAGLGAEELDLLAGAGVKVDERQVAELRSEAGELTAVVFADGGQLPRRGLLAAVGLRQRSDLVAQLGLALAPPSPVAVDAVAVDSMQRTSMPGVFAAGDLCVGMPQVSAAVASGSMAGAAVMQSLMSEDVGMPGPAWPVFDSTAELHWDRHYGERERVWSGRVNVRLAEVAESLPPGRALDLGCGEGADAIWLASKGWQVVATDISGVALARATEDAGELLGRIDFQQHDLDKSFPSGEFDLVSAQFLHSMFPLDRIAVLRKAAAAVAPGGRLVIVDHGAAPPWSKHKDYPFPSVEEVLGALDLGPEWERLRAEPVGREATGPDGHTGHLIDNVMVLRRRS